MAKQLAAWDHLWHYSTVSQNYCRVGSPYVRYLTWITDGAIIMRHSVSLERRSPLKSASNNFESGFGVCCLFLAQCGQSYNQNVRKLYNYIVKKDSSNETKDRRRWVMLANQLSYVNRVKKLLNSIAMSLDGLKSHKASIERGVQRAEFCRRYCTLPKLPRCCTYVWRQRCCN